jgi:transposase
MIQGKRSRKRKSVPDKWRERGRIEATFNRVKDFRRIATRYDKLAHNEASAGPLATSVAFRYPSCPDAKLGNSQTKLV